MSIEEVRNGIISKCPVIGIHGDTIDFIYKGKTFNATIHNNQICVDPDDGNYHNISLNGYYDSINELVMDLK